MLGVILALLIVVVILSTYGTVMWLIFASQSPARELARTARINATARREAFGLDRELAELLSRH